jgi:hypothetical protein
MVENTDHTMYIVIYIDGYYSRPKFKVNDLIKYKTSSQSYTKVFSKLFDCEFNSTFFQTKDAYVLFYQRRAPTQTTSSDEEMDTN